MSALVLGNFNTTQDFLQFLFVRYIVSIYVQRLSVYVYACIRWINHSFTNYKKRTIEWKQKTANTCKILQELSLEFLCTFICLACLLFRRLAIPTPEMHIVPLSIVRSIHCYGSTYYNSALVTGPMTKAKPCHVEVPSLLVYFNHYQHFTQLSQTDYVESNPTLLWWLVWSEHFPVSTICCIVPYGHPRKIPINWHNHYDNQVMTVKLQSRKVTV